MSVSEQKIVGKTCLSVVIPVFNEEPTVAQIIHRVFQQSVVREIIVVDDCSSDGTRDVLEKMAANDQRIRLFHHKTNQGKGAALRTGFRETLADIVIVQDADLEYDPHEYDKLLAPILSRRADAVSVPVSLALMPTGCSISGTLWATVFLPYFQT